MRVSAVLSNLICYRSTHPSKIHPSVLICKFCISPSVCAREKIALPVETVVAFAHRTHETTDGLEEDVSRCILLSRLRWPSYIGLVLPSITTVLIYLAHSQLY